jgi:hypothetical protein
VEEAAAVHIQSASAEAIVSPKQEMKPEDFVLFLCQSSFRQAAEVGHVFLVFAAPASVRFARHGAFRRNPAE